MSDRGLVEGLETPFPIGLMLPALMQGDDFTQRFTTALDQVISPVLSTLDCLDAYFDPSLAPSDFAAWLATWVGVALDENWPLERQREVITRAVALYSWRGTRHGIAEIVKLYVGVEPEVSDSGEIVTSPTPGATLSAGGPPTVTVSVSVADPGAVDEKRVEALVAAAKPAHVWHRVEVRSG